MKETIHKKHGKHGYEERRWLLYADPAFRTNSASSELHESINGHWKDITRVADQPVTPRQCLRSMIVIALVFFLTYTGYASLSNLESSLSLVGEESLSVAGIAGVFGCYFSPVILRIIRPKTSLALAWFSMALFIAANFYPTQYTLFPTCILFGIATGAAWTAQLSYTTNTAITYARLTGKTESGVIVMSNGVFFLAYSSAQVFGNVISSLVIGNGRAAFPIPFIGFGVNTSLTQNFSSQSLGDNSPDNLTCGVEYCPSPNPSVTASQDAPSQHAVNVLLGIFLACVGSGFLVVIFFLDHLSIFVTDPEERREEQTPLDLLLSPIMQFKDTRMLLLLPVMFYVGIQQIFMVAEFTSAYVSCTVGMHYVGYIMTCWGLSSAVASILAGVLVPFVGRTFLTLVAFSIQLALQFHLLLGNNGNQALLPLFLLSCGWGAADGLLHTQIAALVGVTFREDQGAAFAVYRMLQSLGFAITYGCSAILCLRTDLVIISSFLFISVVCYVIVEIYSCTRGRIKVLDVREIENSLTSSFRVYT